MKNAPVDNVRVLLGENHLLGIHLIQPCHRLAGFASLSRRITGRPGIIAFFSPVDKKLHTRFTVMTAETIVVCRPSSPSNATCGNAEWTLNFSSSLKIAFNSDSVTGASSER